MPAAEPLEQMRFLGADPRWVELSLRVRHASVLTRSHAVGSSGLSARSRASCRDDAIRVQKETRTDRLWGRDTAAQAEDGSSDAASRVGERPALGHRDRRAKRMAAGRETAPGRSSN